MTRPTLIAAVLLALVAVAHLLRMLLNMEATIGGVAVPMWVSVIATVVAGGVAILLWRDRRAR
jgi:hypothetical protein